MSNDITSVLQQIKNGDAEWINRLMPLVYDELRNIAKKQRRGKTDAPGTTSVVHEAYLNLVARKHVVWKNRAQFYYLAALVMRNIVIDNARGFARQRHGGGVQHVDADRVPLLSAQRSDELLALDEALCELEALQPRMANIVVCRFFGGMTIPQTADAMEISAATVKRDWALARTWLFRALQTDSAES